MARTPTDEEYDYYVYHMKQSGMVVSEELENTVDFTLFISYRGETSILPFKEYLKDKETNKSFFIALALYLSLHPIVYHKIRKTYKKYKFLEGLKREIEKFNRLY